MAEEEKQEKQEKEEEEEEKEEKTQSQILKEENDALEAELERAQKIRNASLLAGTVGGRVEPVVKPKTDKEIVEDINEAIRKGRLPDGFE